MSDTRGYAAVPNWLVDDETIHPHDKLVYLIMQRHADKFGATFPGVKRMSSKLGISESSVKRAIQRLMTLGLLEVVQQKRYGGKKSEDQSTVYKIHSSLPMPPTSAQPDLSSELSTGHGDLRSQGTELTEEPDLRSEGPLNKTQKNNHRTTRAAGRSVSSPSSSGGEAVTSPGAPVDNFPPPRPLPRPDHCAAHQDDPHPPPCAGCAEARRTMQYARTAMLMTEICPAHGYPPQCPHCPGGRLYTLEEAS